MTSSLGRRWRQAVKLARLLPDPVFRRGVRHGVGAAIEHREVIAPIVLTTVVDVGANVGQFALLASRLHPTARVVAFEPLAEAADRFERLFAGETRITLHRLAVGPAAGTARMHVSARADSSSLLPIGEMQTTVFPGTEEVGTQEVPVAPLDAVVSPADIRPPALLKIDVQGYELEVLKGAESLLDRFKFVYVEASFVPLYDGQPLADEVNAYLAARGFAEVGRHNLARGSDGRPIQADFLFRRADAPAA